MLFVRIAGRSHNEGGGGIQPYPDRIKANTNVQEKNKGVDYLITYSFSFYLIASLTE